MTHPDEFTQDEKRQVLENDRRVRERGTTYSTFAQALADEDRQGRFQTVNQTTHTATNPVYPEQPANSPFHRDPVPDEPALGFSVEDHEPVGTHSEIQRSLEKLGEAGVSPGAPDSGGADVAPTSSLDTSSGDAVEPAAPPTPTTNNSDDNSEGNK